MVVHARTATGDAIPLRTISNAGLHVTGLALDQARDGIFTINDAQHAGIMVFSRAASGTVPAQRTIAGPATFLYADPTIDFYSPALITICH